MNPTLPLHRSRPWLALALWLFALFGASASAAPVSYLAGASVQTDAGFTKSFSQQISASQSGFYNPNPTIYEKADSAANLADGTLHVRSENITHGSGQGQVAMATAFIADSFQHTSGSGPFEWTSNTQASFKIHVDGSTALNPGSGDVFNFGYIALLIYAPGTLDDFIPFCGPTVIQAFFWSVGSRPAATDPCGGAFVGHVEGSAVDQDLIANFMPGSDFDWALGMRVGGAFNANNPTAGTASWLDDFGHTATLSYTGPAGAMVQSGSGVFPGTAPGTVPEPPTLMLLGLGVIGLRWRGRRGGR